MQTGNNISSRAFALETQVVNVLGFNLPFYRSPTLLLSLGLSVRVLWYLLRQRPDVIHVSSPGCLVFSAILYAKLLAIPLVHTALLCGLALKIAALLSSRCTGGELSYAHTALHPAVHLGRLGGADVEAHPLLHAHGRSYAGALKDHEGVLVLQHLLMFRGGLLIPKGLYNPVQNELSMNKCRSKRIDVWQQAVDTEVFHPRFRSDEMRARMGGGAPDSVILTYVGRLGAEKNLKVLREMLLDLPSNVCLAFVGDGPARPDLERHFANLPVTFMVRSPLLDGLLQLQCA